MQVVALHGSGDGVGRGAGGNAELLLPELRLGRFNLIVNLIRLIRQIETLLAKLQEHHREDSTAENAEQKFEHWYTLSGHKLAPLGAFICDPNCGSKLLGYANSRGIAHPHLIIGAISIG